MKLEVLLSVINLKKNELDKFHIKSRCCVINQCNKNDFTRYKNYYIYSYRERGAANSRNRGQDTATWWKILKKGITAYGMDDTLSIYRVGEKSLSSNKLIALKRTWNLYKLENLHFFKRCFCFFCYIWNAIWRRVL